MNEFTASYLRGLHAGIQKNAFDWASPAKGAAIMGSLGAGVGGLGAVALGEERTDPQTGEKSNGVLERLLKGMGIGAAVGGVGGAIDGTARGLINDIPGPGYS